MKWILIFSMLVFPFFSFSATKYDACKTMENSKIGMNVIASNLANVNTTRTPNGGPYRVKNFKCVNLKCQVTESLRVISKYEPHHPDADYDGYVKYPDINMMTQMAELEKLNQEYAVAEKACK